jgi:hypothetical protein
MKKSSVWQNVLTVVIIIVAILIAGAATNLSHIGEAKYLTADKPENVAYNYQLAIIRRDFARAYGFLSPRLPGYPASVEAFEADVRNADAADFSTARCVYIESVNVDGTDAEVNLFEQWKTVGTCPAEKPATPPNPQFNPLFVVLESIDGEWKITSSNGHFPVCWSTNDGCK